MCTITGKSEKKSVIGYKIAVKTETGWHSLYSGIKYEPGKVPMVKLDPRSEKPPENSILPTNKLMWNDDMKGFTGVIATKEGFDTIWKFDDDNIDTLKELLPYKKEGWKIVCLEMKIKGGILEGLFCVQNIYLGNEIVEIKEIETLKIYEQDKTNRQSESNAIEATDLFSTLYVHFITR